MSKSKTSKKTGMDHRLSFGDRVVCIDSRDANSVTIFGYGTYVADEIPDETAAGIPCMMARAIGFPVPKIKLDSGQYIYAGECHWGPPNDDHNALFGNRQIKTVDIDELREKWWADFRELEAAEKEKSETEH